MILVQREYAIVSRLQTPATKRTDEFNTSTLDAIHASLNGCSETQFINQDGTIGAEIRLKQNDGLLYKW
jgi:hypothetical protein